MVEPAPTSFFQSSNAVVEYASEQSSFNLLSIIRERQSPVFARNKTYYCSSLSPSPLTLRSRHCCPPASQLRSPLFPPLLCLSPSSSSLSFPTPVASTSPIPRPRFASISFRPHPCDVLPERPCRLRGRDATSELEPPPCGRGPSEALPA